MSREGQARARPLKACGRKGRETPRADSARKAKARERVTVDEAAIDKLN